MPLKLCNIAQMAAARPGCGAPHQRTHLFTPHAGGAAGTLRVLRPHCCAAADEAVTSSIPRIELVNKNWTRMIDHYLVCSCTDSVQHTTTRQTDIQIVKPDDCAILHGTTKL
jgi:hypothetical protein